METKLLKSLLTRCGIFFVAFCLFGIGTGMLEAEKVAVSKPVQSQMPEENSRDDKEEQKLKDEENNDHKEELIMLEDENTQSTSEIEKKLGTTYVKIRKHQKDLLPIQLKDEYWKKQIVLYVQGLKQRSIETKDVCLAADETNAQEQDARQKKFQKSIQISYEETSDGKLQAKLVLSVDKIYGYVLYEDQEYIYIDCRKPKDVYEKIIVVDAGHGGSDTGSYAKKGDWTEKDYNLDFVQKIEKYWGSKDVKLYVTRLEDKKLSLGQRVNMANQLEADFFVSVHCNSTDEFAGNGLEALYKSNGYAKASKELAAECLERLQEETGLVNRGLLDGTHIYILRSAKMPSILLELGFLSDREECKYLRQEENRERMAKVICQVLEKGME